MADLKKLSKRLGTMIHGLSPTMAIVVGVVLIALAAVLGWAGGTVAKSGFDDLKAAARSKFSASHRILMPLSIQKAAVFFVEIDDSVYQLGVVIKLFNQSNSAEIIKDITLSSAYDNWSFVPRGSYYIQRIIADEDASAALEDSYVRPAAEGYFQRLLPFKIFMTLNAGDMPLMILRGSWKIRSSGGDFQGNIPFYAVNKSPISLDQWQGILKSDSSIKVEDLRYIPFPSRPRDPNATSLLLVYNPDRSAVIDNPYIAQTIAARADAGAMIFVSLPDGVALESGWSSLGRTYEEAWKDPTKRQLYTSIVPADAHGRPQAFGFFAGREQAMAGSIGYELFAPTTRPADILEMQPSRQVN